MHIDASDLTGPTLFEADLCIVGAGAAGIAIATQWLDTTHDALLIEAGQFELDDRLQESFRAEVVGRQYLPLDANRLHYFGGTTNIWGGLCARFDPIDFMARSWVPHSGWPIDISDLERFYEVAEGLLELGNPENEAQSAETIPVNDDNIATKLYRYSPPSRLGPMYQKRFERSQKLKLLTSAKVREIVLNESRSCVAHVCISMPNGLEHTVRARHYVLGCGAIENARLLLASNTQCPAGIGNENDQVGRYFMEHPSIIGAGHLHFESPRSLRHYWHEFRRTRTRRMLIATESIQRDEQLLNCAIELSPSDGGTSPTSWFLAKPTSRTFLSIWHAAERAYQEGRLPVHPPLTALSQVNCQCEQAPNPESRVLLSAERDVFGIPRACLNWQISDLEPRTIRRLCELLGEAMVRAQIGRLVLADGLPKPGAEWDSAITAAGFHHIGTTRMHRSPKYGVVDKDCRVHGLSNLWVAGASVFPTSGAAHPTLTLVALALRLSSHLKHFQMR